MKKLYILLLFSLIGLNISAQHVISQNFMRYNPYFNVDNPAHHTPYKGYFGFPALSNLNVSLTNTSLHYNKLFTIDNDGYPIAINTEKFLNSLSRKNNWLSLSLNEEILGFGFRINRVFLSFSTRTRIDQYLRFSQDLMTLPIQGNMAFTGENNYANPEIDLSLDAYQEFSVGVQIEATKKLYLGVKPKLLLGIANVKTNNLSAKVYTDPLDYTMRVDYNVDVSAVAAVPIQYINDSLIVDLNSLKGNYRSALKNLGFSLDLGAVYRINDKMGVGASLLDMGFIQWKTDGIRVSSSIDDVGTFYDNGSFLFSGLNTEQMGQLLENEETRQEFLDSLKYYFPVDFENVSGERVTLTMRMSAEFYYQLNEKHRFTALFMGSFIGKKMMPQFSVAYNGKLAKVFDICAHYTMKPNNFTNLGVGIGFDLWPVYLYMGTDNIFAAFNPTNSNTVNFQFGLLFKWGKVKEKVIKIVEKPTE